MIQAHLDTAFANRGARILVVDDHDDSRTITRMVLEHAGYEVSEARTGTEGLRKALDERPEMVLVDIALPGMDGWEVSRRLRANEATSDARILAVTALTGADIHERSIRAGCDDLLTKPVHIATLRHAIRSHLTAQRTAKRQAAQSAQRVVSA